MSDIDQKALEAAVNAAMQHISRDGNDEGDVFDGTLAAIRAYEAWNRRATPKDVSTQPVGEAALRALLDSALIACENPVMMPQLARQIRAALATQATSSKGDEA